MLSYQRVYGGFNPSFHGDRMDMFLRMYVYVYIYIYHYVCACVFQYFNIIHINDYVFYDMKYSKLRIYPKASLYNGN